MPKILIADDSRVQVYLLSTYLAKKGFDVIVAVDALQAWAMALRERPDAILLDMNMPAGSGIDVLKKLRMSTETLEIPVVVITADNGVDVAQTTMEKGASAFLNKPTDPDQLYATLTRLIVGYGEANPDGH